MFELNSQPVTTKLHWHAHAVGSLCFTNDGKRIKTEVNREALKSTKVTIVSIILKFLDGSC